MITKELIQKLVEEKLAEGTNFIVDIAVKPGNKIFILLDNAAGLPISDCVAVSKFVESNLDREKEDFELNVSSPGLDQPFKVLQQYIKNIGKQVAVLTKENKKLSGKLVSANENGIEIETKSTERVEGKKGKQLLINNINLTFNQLKETKVVVSF
ncbi:MAG: ribosome assembly cofactor RimP [Bacteroidia bacterium]|nr:ribosome assembly cofactor RimP [Bacteroidia bacterium]